MICQKNYMLGSLGLWACHLPHIRLPKLYSSYLSGIKFYSDSKRLLKSRIQMSKGLPTVYQKERNSPGL